MTNIRPAPLAPMSWGELLDKITILEIKAQRIAAPAARACDEAGQVALHVPRAGHARLVLRRRLEQRR